MMNPVLALLAAIGLAFLALLGLAYWSAGRLLFPQRQPLTSSPAHHGLPYENVAFRSADGLTLRGWWIPAGGAGQADQPAPTLILLPPMFGNRHGLRARRAGWPGLLRTDIDLFPAVQAFHQAGLTVLLFDFRGHGESQAGLCAGGQTEDQDVVGAVDYAFSRLESQAPSVAVMGFGLAAAAALVAVGRYKGGTEKTWVFTGDSEGGAGWTEILPANVKRLCALVLVQPTSLGGLVRDYLRQVAAPLSTLLLGLVSTFCQRRGGYPLDPQILHKYAREVRVPVLYIHAAADSGGSLGEARALQAVTPGAQQGWWIDTPPGPAGTFACVVERLQPVLAFLQQAACQGSPSDRL